MYDSKHPNDACLKVTFQRCNALARDVSRSARISSNMQSRQETTFYDNNRGQLHGKMAAWEQTRAMNGHLESMERKTPGTEKKAVGMKLLGLRHMYDR